MHAERVDAVVVMHADGDERGERYDRTGGDLLVLYAESRKLSFPLGAFLAVL